MIDLSIKKANKILCLGAHSDDIEIGCGGTLLKIAQDNPNCEVHWIVFSANEHRKNEAIESVEEFLRAVKIRNIEVKNFRDSFFPYEGEGIKEEFEIIKKKIDPDIVFTHFRDDRHQDHRVLSDLAWNTFRNNLILEYEVPKYDGDLGQPNVFLEIDEDLASRKVDLLCRYFQTQTNKHWFSRDLFLSLMRIRGVESASQYAEAFYCRKLKIGLR